MKILSILILFFVPLFHIYGSNLEKPESDEDEKKPVISSLHCRGKRNVVIPKLKAPALSTSTWESLLEKGQKTKQSKNNFSHAMIPYCGAATVDEEIITLNPEPSDSKRKTDFSLDPNAVIDHLLESQLREFYEENRIPFLLRKNVNIDYATLLKNRDLPNEKKGLWSSCIGRKEDGLFSTMKDSGLHVDTNLSTASNLTRLQSEIAVRDQLIKDLIAEGRNTVMIIFEKMRGREEEKKAIQHRMDSGIELVQEARRTQQSVLEAKETLIKHQANKIDQMQRDEQTSAQKVSSMLKALGYDGNPKKTNLHTLILKLEEVLAARIK